MLTRFSGRGAGYTGAQMAPGFVVAGLVALAAAGCGGGDEAAREAPEQKLPADAQTALDELDASARPPDDAEEIARVLDDRARALEATDSLALSATATGDQRARDRRSAKRAKRLSIDRVRLVAGDLETSGGRAKARVNMSYRVRGMHRPFRTVRQVVLRDESAGWRVERDAPRREPLPWEVADFKLTRAPHVVLLTPRGVDAERLSGGLAVAYRSIRHDLPALGHRAQRAGDRRPRRGSDEALGDQDHTRRGRARRRRGQLGSAAGVPSRARARRTDDRGRLALAQAVRGGAPGDARARDDAYGAQPRYVAAHAGVAGRGRRAVRVRRRPRERGAAARGRRRAEHQAAPPLPAGLDHRPERAPAGSGLRRQLRRRRGDRAAVWQQGAVQALRRVQRLDAACQDIRGYGGSRARRTLGMSLAELDRAVAGG